MNSSQVSFSYEDGPLYVPESIEPSTSTPSMSTTIPEMDIDMSSATTTQWLQPGRTVALMLIVGVVVVVVLLVGTGVALYFYGRPLLGRARGVLLRVVRYRPGKRLGGGMGGRGMANDGMTPAVPPLEMGNVDSPLENLVDVYNRQFEDLLWTKITKFEQSM